MTAEPGTEILQAAVSTIGIWVCTTQTSLRDVIVSLRSNCYLTPEGRSGIPRDRRFKLARHNCDNLAGSRQAPARRSSLRGLPKQSAARLNQGIEAPNHFGSQTKLGSNGAIPLAGVRCGSQE